MLNPVYPEHGPISYVPTPGYESRESVNLFWISSFSGINLDVFPCCRNPRKSAKLIIFGRFSFIILGRGQEVEHPGTFCSGKQSGQAYVNKPVTWWSFIRSRLFMSYLAHAQRVDFRWFVAGGGGALRCQNGAVLPSVSVWSRQSRRDPENPD